LNNSPAEILQQGLALVHYDGQRQALASNKTKRSYFKSHYWSHPEVVAQIWLDLQSMTIPHARIDDADEKDLEFYLQAHHFLLLILENLNIRLHLEPAFERVEIGSGSLSTSCPL
jgi:hypothetical protein